MELKQLRAFIAVAEELSFSRAADRLHMTQPPLSVQIRKLEEELGIRLLERGRNQAVRLTAAGESLLEGARTTVSAARQAVEGSQRAARGRHGRLSVGCTDDFVYYSLADILSRLHRENPEVTIEYNLRSSPTLLKQVLSRSLDAAFICLPPSAIAASLRLTPLPSMPILAVVPENHPLAGRRAVWLNDLRDEMFHLMPERIRSGFSINVSRLFSQAGFVPARYTYGTPTILALEAVARGVGVTLASAGSIPPGLPRVRKLQLKDQQATLGLAVATHPKNDSIILNRLLEVASAK